MMTQRILRGKPFWIILCSLACILWIWNWAYHNKTIGFSVKKITSNFAYNPDWVIPEPQGQEFDQLQSIFHQKFKYLASGSQSYAFVSEDGKYVIKFFRMKHLIPSIRDYLKPGRLEHRRQNLISIFGAHKLAYDELREDSGLVYLHLNKTQHLNTKLKATDRLGRSYEVDLDKTEFVVQKKAELIFDRLKKLLDKGDRAGADKAIASMLQMIKRQLDMKIVDQDKAVRNNYGFIGDQPVHLDIGRLYRGEKPKDYDRVIERINKWLHENDSDTYSPSSS
jgi:hypothetical protein